MWEGSGGEGRGGDSRAKGDLNIPQHSLTKNTVIFLGLTCVGKSNSFIS